jgi:hypothetical protein
VDVAAQDSLELDELPAEFPLRRPRTFAYCLALGLGTRIPCPFATCKHSLLVDEIRGQVHDDGADLWQIETCSLAVSGRGRRSALEVARITGLCESSVEEWQRRGIRKIKAKLDIAEFDWPPMNRGFKLDVKGVDGLDRLVAARWKLPMPALNVAPARLLTREQAAALFGADHIHPRYGERKAASVQSDG